MEIDYFPPPGTKYQWHHPELRGRPWWSRPSLGFVWPRDLVMNVGRLDTLEYWGSVRFWDIYGEIHNASTPLGAEPRPVLLACEALAEKILAEQNLPPWAEEALAAGWRPPSRKGS